MRVYKFLDAHYGLKSLYEKRLKISRIDELNDPFELSPFVLSKQKDIEAIRAVRDKLNPHRGLLCFSADWQDPVIWAHYSDKHRGVCLGFEVPEEVTKPVTYIHVPRSFPDRPSPQDAEMILFTKYKNWEYEREVRIWARLETRDDGHLYFADFSEQRLKLVEVIAGVRCDVPRRECERALGEMKANVKLTKARTAFDSFRIVIDERGFK